MCEPETTVSLEIPAQPGWTRHIKDGKKRIGVDACLAPLIQVLNDNGFPTLACCCGHGYHPGNIVLMDGREFIIAPDYESSRIAERAFPNASGEWHFEEGRILAEKTREWIRS